MSRTAISLTARNLLGAAVAILACMFSVSLAFAQSSDTGCSLDQVAGASRQILRCERGLTITVEPGARFTLVDRDGDGNADSVRLRQNALLLDSPTGAVPAGFQVVTPQAIAAVRGTRWAVDVQRGRTSVFVVRGRVAVARPVANASVLLGPGEGVDVEGTGPLTVRRWPAARVSALLARFGQ